MLSYVEHGKRFITPGLIRRVVYQNSSDTSTSCETDAFLG